MMQLHSMSLRRITGSYWGVAWQSWLHCPLIDPTKAQAQTPLTSTLVLQTRCHSAGLIPCPRNYWSTWQKLEGRTCAPWAHTCSVSQGLDLPTTLQDQRPQCEHKHKLWNYLSLAGLKIQHTGHPKMCDQDLHLKDQRFIKQNTNKHIHTHWKHGHSMLSSPCAFSGLHLDNPLDTISLTCHTHTFVFVSV